MSSTLDLEIPKGIVENTDAQQIGSEINYDASSVTYDSADIYYNGIAIIGGEGYHPKIAIEMITPQLDSITY